MTNTSANQRRWHDNTPVEDMSLRPDFHAVASATQSEVVTSAARLVDHQTDWGLT
jgi:hypothetical protein